MTRRPRFLLCLCFSSLAFLAGAVIPAQAGWFPQTSPVATTLRSLDFIDGSNGWICGDGGVILRTTDGGASWVSQESGIPWRVNEIDFCDLENGYAAADRWTLLRTTNGGDSWQIVHTGDEYSTPLRSLSVLDPLTVWTAWTADNYPYSSGAIAVTTNGGATWSRGSVTHNDGHPCSVASLDVAGLSATTACLSCDITRYDYSHYGLAFRTTDACSSFTITTGSQRFDEIKFIGSGIAFGGPRLDVEMPGGGLRWTTNGGVTWTVKASFPVEFRDFSFVGTTLGWIAGDGGVISRTDDGCATWTAQTSGTTQNLLGIQFVSPSVGTAVGANGTILRTITGGEGGAEVAGDTSVNSMDLTLVGSNPSSGSVRIGYSLPEAAPVMLEVFDVNGRMLRELDAGVRASGSHEIQWDGANESRRPVPAGVYLVRLSTPGGSRHHSLVITR